MGWAIVWTTMVGCRGQLASWRRVTHAVAREQRKVQSWGMGDWEGPRGVGPWQEAEMCSQEQG